MSLTSEAPSERLYGVHAQTLVVPCLTLVRVCAYPPTRVRRVSYVPFAAAKVRRAAETYAHRRTKPRISAQKPELLSLICRLYGDYFVSLPSQKANQPQSLISNLYSLISHLSSLIFNL